MSTTNPMMCPRCGIAMNYHAEKVDYTTALSDPKMIDSDLGGVLEEIHTCPDCGQTEARSAVQEEASI